MYELRYLVFIRRRGPFGLNVRVPVVRTAHVDGPTVMRLGRRFTFEDMMRPSIAADADSARAASPARSAARVRILSCQA